MSNINNRLEIFISSTNMSVKKFSSTLGYSNGEKISRLFRDGNEDASPSVDILQDIANAYPELSMDWVISGTGDMLKSKQSPVVKTEDIEKPREYSEIIAYLDKIYGEQKKMVAKIETIQRTEKKFSEQLHTLNESQSEYARIAEGVISRSSGKKGVKG